MSSSYPASCLGVDEGGLWLAGPEVQPIHTGKQRTCIPLPPPLLRYTFIPNTPRACCPCLYASLPLLSTGLALAALRQRAARLLVSGAEVLQAACGGPNAPLSFEGTPWNSSTVAVIAAAKAHTEMVLLQVSVWGLPGSVVGQHYCRLLVAAEVFAPTTSSLACQPDLSSGNLAHPYTTCVVQVTPPPLSPTPTAVCCCFPSTSNLACTHPPSHPLPFLHPSYDPHRPSCRRWTRHAAVAP